MGNIKPWVPWDADDDETVELWKMRERVPESMRPALQAWLYARLNNGSGQTHLATLNELQTALDTNLGLAHGPAWTEDLVPLIIDRGERFSLQVVDWLLAGHDAMFQMPGKVRELSWHLDTARSSLMVEVRDRVYRLARRLPDGVEEAIETTVTAGPALSGQHLSKALRALQGLEADPSLAMAEAFKAVEAAAGPVVTPLDKKVRLSKIVDALKAKTRWSIEIDRREDGHPDHRAILIGMLETVALAQPDRHGGNPPSQAQAQSIVFLASTLIGWFSVGVVQMNEK